MQKISSYLLNNRVELVANLAGFITEWKPVYKRHIKIYNGIDNTIEFDIKNADQKRIDLSTLGGIEMNIMDNQGYALPNSPYTLDTLNQTTSKGLATVTIPQEDLVDLVDQSLTYSVTTRKDGKDVMLYADASFAATGTIELIGNAMPIIRDSAVYDYFNGAGDFNNTTITFFSDSINLKFRDAVPPTQADISINLDNLEGSVWVEATKDTVIGHESFTYKGTRLATQSTVSGDTLVNFTVDLLDYTYIRVNYTKDPKVTTGKIVNFNVDFS
jgi:hypothetical protein